MAMSGDLFSQNLQLSGKVIERTSKEPLEGATVFLTAPGDSAALAHSVSDTAGNFQIDLAAGGNFVFHIQYLGFNPYDVPLELNGSTNLGVLALEPSKFLLNSVLITGQKTPVSLEFDRQVYQVSQDLFSESSSASEILQNIPSVTVDIDGEIKLRNRSNIAFFVNGKPSAMLRRNAESYLEQIPASSIERIEIITNPSAKYRPDGVGGIINLVLKREAGQGWNGLLGLNIGNEERANGNARVNYGGKKINFTGNYGIQHTGKRTLFSDARVYKHPENLNKKSDYLENGQFQNDGWSHSVFLGSAWDPNPYNQIEAGWTYFLQNSFHDGFSDISNTNHLGQPLSVFNSRNTKDNYEREGEFSFSWERQFRNQEDRQIAFQFTHSDFDEAEDLGFEQVYSVPSVYTQLNSIGIDKNGNQQEWMLDFVTPLGEEGELEAGYAGERVFENIEYTNPAFSRFEFTQTIHAGYAQIGKRFGILSAKAGLRAEQTHIRAHLLAPSDSLSRNAYFKAFPTLHLGLETSTRTELALSYSKRLNRPDSDELNPNPEYTDPRNAEAGNPALLPEQTHSVELGFRYKGNAFTLANTLYYRYEYDAFTELRQSLDDNTVLTTIENLNAQQSAGLEIVLNSNLFARSNINLTGNVFHRTIDATDLGYAGQKRVVSGNIKVNSMFQIGAGTRAQFNAFYYFPSINPQGKRSPYFYLNGGLRQQVLRNRAAITLTATDLLYTYEVKRRIESEELSQRTSTRRRVPIVYVGFTWKWNNTKIKDELLFEGEN